MLKPTEIQYTYKKQVITCVYIIENILNKKVYVGSAVNFYKRKNLHLRQLKTNKHINFKLQNFVNKHGIDKLYFKIIQECEKKDLIRIEQYYIDLYDCVKCGFNILPTAGSWLNHKHTELSKLKMSKPKKRMLNINKNKRGMKPVNLQYVYKKQVGFTLQQKNSLNTLEKYGVNVNDFIRIAVKEKLHREWRSIKEEKEKIKLPF